MSETPGQVYICPAGNHPVFLYGNGTIVPHYDGRGIPCSANYSRFIESNVRLPLIVWQGGRELFRLPGDSWTSRFVSWVARRFS